MIGHSIGKYRVIDRIGRGGMGTVYRATDDTLHRDVAIKVLHAELNDPEVARRFRAEAITVARLSHPGIATVYELFEHDGQWLMVMEFLRGVTLEALVEKTGVLSPQRAAELCLHVLAALAHAHNLGVVHRDLKPANLMLTESGAVKVMDFGIARVSGTDHLTAGGYMMGTPAYMAPEQVLGREIDARVDLYAMGVVMYRLVTGTLPFRGESPFALAQSQVNDPPTPAGLVRTDLPAWVDQIISRALAKNPTERFQSAAAFHDVLARCIAGRDPAATYDPGADTEVMVTPAFPLPAAVVRPITATMPIVAGGDTAPMAVPVISGSGAMARMSASIPVVKAQPVPPAAAFTRSNRLVMYGAAVIVVITIATAVAWNRFGRTPDAAPGSVTTDVPQTIAPPPAPTPTPASGTPAPINSTTSRGASTSTPPAGRPSGPAPTSTPNPSSASGVGAGRAGAARRGATPAEFQMIPGLKLITLGTNAKVQETDVALTMAAGHVSIAPATGGKPLQFMPLASIKKATFVHGDDPLFDPALAAPPVGAKFTTRLAKNWLVLQDQQSFMIIRLENATTQVLSALEAAGTKITRATPVK